MSTALRTYYRGHSLVAMRDEVAQQTRVRNLRPANGTRRGAIAIGGPQW